MELEGEAEVEKEEVTKGVVNVSGEKAGKVSKEDGVRKVRRLVDPLKPIQKEVDEHNLFHTPYRNWCPICIIVKKAEDHQRKNKFNPSGYSEYSFDYGFPGDEFGFKLTVFGNNGGRG